MKKKTSRKRPTSSTDPINSGMSVVKRATQRDDDTAGPKKPTETVKVQSGKRGS